jgi:hypothetical protein
MPIALATRRPTFDGWIQQEVWGEWKPAYLIWNAKTDSRVIIAYMIGCVSENMSESNASNDAKK